MLTQRGFRVVREASRDVVIDGLVFPGALRVDMVVDEQVLVEIKTVETILPVHRAQALAYLGQFKAPVAFLINFRSAHLKDGIRRFVDTSNLG